MPAAAPSPLRFIVVGVVALGVGLALGGLGPRAELRSLQAQRDGDPAKCEKSGIGRQIASALRGRPWEANREVEPVRQPEPRPEPEPVEDAPQPSIEITFGEVEDPEARKSEDIEQGAEMMRDAMALRKAQARAALDEAAAPTDAQWDDIDGAIADMNDDLKMLAEEFVDTIGSGQEPTRREAMLFAADTLEVMLEADDRLYESLTPEQIENIDDEVIDPFAHIDPDIVDVFLELDR